MKAGANYKLTGAEVVALMRRHGKTIAGIAAEADITRKRVRHVRSRGVTGFMADEWHYFITGKWWSDEQLATIAS